MKNHDSASIRLDASRRVVRHLLLDSRGVLYDDSAWKRWLLGLLGRMGLHTHYAAFFRVWDREFQPEVWQGTCDFAQALRHFLQTAGLSPAQVDEILASTRAKLRAFESEIRPYPGVRATVCQLGAYGARLSIASRMPGRTPEVQAFLKRSGLKNRLQEVLVAEDSTHHHDAASYYRWITAQNRWPSHEVAYVGRDPAELDGAAQAGMMTIAFNYDADAVADHYIDQFDQLIGLMDTAPEVLATGIGERNDE